MVPCSFHQNQWAVSCFRSSTEKMNEMNQVTTSCGHYTNHLVGQKFKIKNQVRLGLFLLGKAACKRVKCIKWLLLMSDGMYCILMELPLVGWIKCSCTWLKGRQHNELKWSMTAQWIEVIYDSTVWQTAAGAVAIESQSVQQVLEVRNQPFWPQTTVWSFRRIQQTSLK